MHRGVLAPSDTQPTEIKASFSMILEARVGIEPALTDLQSAALPLCHRALGHYIDEVPRQGAGLYTPTVKIGKSCRAIVGMISSEEPL